LCGWNAAGFDHPYLVNYGLSNGVGSVYDLAPVGRVYEMDGSGNWINSSLKGRQLLDLMTLYQKTRVSELDSYRLTDVAEAEGLSVGKLDLEAEIDVPDDEPAIDYAWRERPQKFLDYSLRDVKACVGINNETQEEVNII
jgi:DNA polymerase elongation subunit (family B)